MDNGTLTPAAQETLVTFALSLVLATAAGSVLGVLVGAFRRVDRALGPSLEFARSMPPAAMVPIAALLIGYGETMKVAVVTFAAVWPVLLNAAGRRAEPRPVLVDAARSLHLSWFDTVRKCMARVLAARGPGGRAGGLGHHPALVEILTRVGGLGGLIALSQLNYLSAQVYGLLVAGLFSFLVNGVVAVLEGVVFRNRPR